MADKATILQNAQRFMTKGQLDKAIEEWQKLISESPNDGNIYNTIGDLLLKKNELSRAVEAYLKGAEVFHAAGFSLKTIAIYKKLIKLVPQRLDILIKLGDLNSERGLTGNAIEDYLTAAKQYSHEGNVREALEVYRKIANLDPSNTAIRLKLADLCLKEGFQEQAIDEFSKVAESYLQSNRSKDAEALCERILKLDPKNEAARKLMGQPSVSQDVPSKPESSSKELLLPQIDGAIEKGLLDEARRLLGEFMKLDPDDPAGPCRLGTVLLKSGNKDEAFEQLKKAADQYVVRSEYGQAGKLMKDYLETDPDRVEAHLKLAEVYDRGNNPHLAVSAYAHVIDDYLVSGETALAKDLYTKIKTLEPQHRDVRRLRHTFETTEISRPHIIIPLETARTSEAAVEPAPTSSAPSAALQESATEAVSSPAGPAPILDQAALNSLFTEAEVYLKYGLSVKAVEQLQQVLAMDPENETAHQQLKEIYKNEGQTEKAVEECFRLMEIYKKSGDPERQAAVLAEAKALDPKNPRVREVSDLALILDSGRMKAILEEEPVALKIPQSSPVGDRPGQEAVAQEATHAEISSGSLQQKEDVSEQMAEADSYRQQGLRDEAKKMYELILALQQDHPAALEKLETITAEEALEKEMKAREAQKAKEIQTAASAARPSSKPKEQTPASIQKPKTPEPAKKKSTDEQMLDDELEKSFAPFMGGEPEESLETAGPAGAKPSEADGTIDLEALLKEDEAPVKKPGKPSSTSKGSNEEFIDLSGILDEEPRENVKIPVSNVSSDEASVSEQLDSIFSEFQKDAEQVSDDIDYETHYNLGIAYKEMGLLTEAIVEFKQAMNGPDRFIDASNMLAACLQENGNNRDAIKILERALSDARCDDAQGLWLRYDLASLCEKESRMDEALELFNLIARSDRNFKDVVQRIENLEGLLGKPKQKIKATKAIEQEDEDVDAMMERVFGESAPGAQSKGAKAGVKENAKKKDRISYL
ncbi:MAG: tetratricopeptide repeat protein [Nitrospirae bacterium]|nr:tetratricopeptide repeat protein [Nitrospirota bacterium]